jgi:hypothetical protein
MSEAKYQLLCPACGRPLTIPAEMFGRDGKCPRCAATFVVNAVAVTPLPADTPRAAGDLPEPAGWDDTDRPWERPGAVRRDALPYYRDWLLLTAGTASLVLAFACLCLPFVGMCAALVAAPTYACARHDLALMRAGLLERYVRTRVRRAREFAFAALLLSGGNLLFTVVMTTRHFAPRL